MSDIHRTSESYSGHAAAGRGASEPGGNCSFESEKRQTYPAGTELFGQGTPVRDVFWLDDGLVKLVHVKPDGGERILGLRFSPRPLGVALAVVKLPSPVSAVTVTRCQIRRISGHDLARAIAADERLSAVVHRAQSEEVLEQFQMLAELSASSSRDRLEHFLLRLVVALSITTANMRLQLPLKHYEIAQFIAVTPEHLSRLFRQLCDEGVIGFHKGWLTIKRLDRLAGASDRCGVRSDIDRSPSMERLSA